jgi:hypothetical protein
MAATRHFAGRPPGQKGACNTRIATKRPMNRMDIRELVHRSSPVPVVRGRRMSGRQELMLARRLSRSLRDRGWFRFRVACLAQATLRSRRQSCYCPCLFRGCETSAVTETADKQLSDLPNPICQPIGSKRPDFFGFFRGTADVVQGEPKHVLKTRRGIARCRSRAARDRQCCR